MLIDNNSVELEDLGVFSLEIKGKMTDTPEQFTSGKIKNISMAFRAAKQFKKELKKARFTKD